jgi:hypothetical protein
MPHNIPQSQDATTTISLIQGIWNQFYYDVVDSSFAKFKIYDKEIDISTIRVYVYKTATSSTNTEYVAFGNSSKITDKTFFTVIDSDGYYNIIFGDDKVASRPSIGSKVMVEFIHSDGSIANDCTNISSKDIDVLSYNKSYGGDDIENIHSIDIGMMRNKSISSLSDQYRKLLSHAKFDIIDCIAINNDFTVPRQPGVITVYVDMGKSSQRPIEVETFLNANKFNTGIVKVKPAKQIGIKIKVFLNSPFDEFLHNEIKTWCYNYSNEKLNKLTTGFYPNDFVYALLDKFEVKLSNVDYKYQIPLDVAEFAVNDSYIQKISSGFDVKTVEYSNTFINVYDDMFTYQHTGESFFTLHEFADNAFINEDSFWKPSIIDCEVLFEK